MKIGDTIEFDLDLDGIKETGVIVWITSNDYRVKTSDGKIHRVVL